MSNSNKKSFFIEGGQILTNLEEYSFKVQKEAEDYAVRIKKEIDQQKAEAEQSLQETLAKRSHIEDESAAIIDNAHQEAEKIITKAQQEGYQKGLQEAQTKFQKDIDQKMQDLDSIIRQLSNYRQKILQEAEQDIINLCLLIGRKITLDETVGDPSKVLNMIHKFADQFIESKRIKILLNPKDIEYVKEHSSTITALLDSSQQVIITKDNKVSLGSVVIETDSSEFSYQLADEIKKIDQLFADIHKQKWSNP